MIEDEKKTISKERTPFFTFVRILACIVFHTVAPVKRKGAEKIKNLNGPAIIIANHSSMIDPVIIAQMVKDVQVTFLGKAELSQSKIGSIIFRLLHMIPVQRGKSDMTAMRSCMNALKEKRILGIFPEGTRHKKGLMQDLETGTAMIAVRTKVPLIPVYIKEKRHLFNLTHVEVGDPIDYSDLTNGPINNETCQELNNRIKEYYRKYQ